MAGGDILIVLAQNAIVFGIGAVGIAGSLGLFALLMNIGKKE